MHIKSLKVFCEIVSRRSFSRAADENGISQSGASQIVHQLEDHLGVKLIDRSKRPFVLTPEGELYYAGCRKLVQRWDTLEEEVRTLHHEVAGCVHVVSIYSVGLSQLNRIVQDFLSRHPKANVRLEYHHPDRVYELVNADQADLGIVSFPKATRSIQATPWREDPMVLVCSPENELANSQSISSRQLAGAKFVNFDPDLKIRREIDRTLGLHGVDIQTVLEFDNTENIKRAIEIDAGVALLPAPTVSREVELGSLVQRPLEDISLIRPVGIIQRRGHELGQTAHRFLQLLENSATHKPSPNGHSQADADGKSSDPREHITDSVEPVIS